MAYIEVWKSGKLLMRRRADEQKAQKGCRVRLGSAGEVRVAVGQPETLGEFEVRMFAGEPPIEQSGIEETASLSPDEVRSVSPCPAEAGGFPTDKRSDYPDIKGYKIIELLGEGGMGVVWRAEQLSTRREVALKLLISHRVDSPKDQARFQREVELTARLDHPNIARIYDSGLHLGMYYYAMELVDGVPLDKYVKSKSLSMTQILALVQKVCQGVLYAHLRAVIHRDLKPSNIIVSPDGQPHVLDFGLAKALLDEDEALTISIEGQIAGSPAYMSPEQAAGHHSQTDTRTDVFSLGVILYELLTGYSPHDLSGSMFDLLHEITEGKIRSPREVDKSIDPELEAILLKALAHEPEDRYASAGALAKDINNYLDEEPLDARVPTTLYFLRKKALKYKKQVGIAAAVLIIIFVTVFSAYTKVVGDRAVLRAAQERNKSLETELVDLRARILSGDPEEVEAALAVLEQKYLASQMRVQELLRMLGSTSELAEPAASVTSDTGFYFGEPVNLGAEINTSATERGPSISTDGLSFYFDSRRPGGIGRMDVWVAKRATVSEPWGKAENLGPMFNTPGMDIQPHISADGLSLYFTSDRSGGSGHGDIWLSTRLTKNDKWPPPVNLGPIVNTSDHDGAPSISADGLSLYFESGRPSPDIWVTMRTSIFEPWKPPVNLGSVFNSTYSESVPYISPDSSILYFSSSRPDGHGGDDIWQIGLSSSDSGD